jgi:hypothetical protein
MRPPALSRRHVLRAGAVGVSLPFLEAMLPRRRAAAAVKPRFVAFYQPNGVNMAKWRPQGEGTGWQLGAAMAPLARVKDQLTVLSHLRLADENLTHRGFATILTGYKETHPEAKTMTSADQLIARAYEGQTRFASLQFLAATGLDTWRAPDDPTRIDCKIDASTLAVRGGTPLPNMCNPAKVFRRLFGAPTPVDRLRPSVLDAVRARTRELRAGLGMADQRRLDEYLDGIRHVEQTLAKAPAGGAACDAAPGAEGVPANRDAYVRVMIDLLVLALRCDLTRVATFLIGVNNSETPFEFDGKKYLFHAEISHHGGDAYKRELCHRMDHWHMTHLGYLLEKMAAIEEPGGTLLHNSLVYFSSEVSDGDGHTSYHMPVLLAGRAGGAVRSGRHIDLPFKKEPNRPPSEAFYTADLLLTLLRHYGVERDRLGQFGTRRLTAL